MREWVAVAIKSLQFNSSALFFIVSHSFGVHIHFHFSAMDAMSGVEWSAGHHQKKK